MLTLAITSHGHSQQKLWTKILLKHDSCRALKVQCKSSGSAGRDFVEASSGKAAALKRLLSQPSIIQGPCCFDALGGKLIEMDGFPVAVMSGFSVSASRLGEPDTGLLSYGEMVQHTELIASAINIPLIADADTGYGNAVNVKRTVKGYATAGAAALIIEDQVWPKACGHTHGRQVVPRAEAVARIRAAVDARDEGGNKILIVARSDARQAVSLEDALWRAQAFADVGADMVFIDALSTKADMAALCRVAPSVPKMANMLEGGVTPVLSPLELEELGFKLVVYPLSLLGVSIRAMQNALKSLKSGRMPPPSALPSFSEIRTVVGFDKYYREESRYTAADDEQTQDTAADINGGVTPQSVEAPADLRCVGDFECDDESPFSKVVEAEVLQDSQDDPWSSAGSRGQTPSGLLSAAWSRIIRLKISDVTGKVKFEVKVPAGFLDGLAATIPAIAGIDLKRMLDEKTRNSIIDGQPIIDIVGKDGSGDRVQVFLE